MRLGRGGGRGPSSFLNCGTLLALFGLGVFLCLGYVLFQILCYGPGGAVPTPSYPA